MSLLLEALKKAELAKQAAKEEPSAANAPPFTRDQLPDITQPMEIHSDDLTLAEPAPAPRRADKPALELALEEPVRPAPAAPPPRPAPSETSFTAPSEAAERKQAQQLFEAKDLEVNPRKPFYITLGALGVFALGTVVYFWYQLHPRSAFSAAPAPARTTTAPPLAAAPAPQPGVPIAATVTPPIGTQLAPAPTAPSASATAGGTTQAAAAQAAEPAPVQPRARSTARARPAAPATSADAGAARPGAARREGAITITPAKVQINPVLEGAYHAFNAGDLVRAREEYQQVLRNEPDNRDALLGLAAVEMQARHYGAAGSIYTHLLVLDPRDAYAEAAMIGLKGEVDPLSGESRVKNMIAAQPDASFLQFTLGNQYAAQGRWAEAQQAYFRAYAGDPEHPDFAYNLAVSLDKLHQSKPALQYYRRALTLAAGHPASFDRAQVTKRVSQLAR